MRHSAWLGAVPEAAPGARADAAKLSRRERIERDGGEIEMPPFDEGEYLIAYLYELGPTVAADMGAGPVTFAEMAAWQAARGFELEPWEARLLRRLSVDYLAESHRATQRDCRPPWGGSVAVRVSHDRAAARALELFLA
ncbi:hypothetical protein [Janthinobacterium svalbardensis]|uniref:hypothetical protein n=1 Tax=Janthinobacterium svalbardensis TaxID=368607 RepID=UPI002FCDBB11